MSSTPVLLDIGSNAYANQTIVDEVKRRIGVKHNYFDCWIFGFLENKNFNVDETIAKLKRREEFEKTQLSKTQITDWMLENMQKGIIQLIGNDKEGRVTFYVCTARDKPSSARREESRMNFDMFVSYGTRLRPESKRCQMAMLINQDTASMWTNLDMTFQADIALRIAKFYPGCVDKLYICKMNRMLAAMAKPIFKRLPSIVSDRIAIISDSDIKNGKLLEFYDESVLPVALGGSNDCDHEANYIRFAHTIKEYTSQLTGAINRGLSVKEWELQNLEAAGYATGSSRMDVLKRSIMEPSCSVRNSLSRLQPDRSESWSLSSGRSEKHDTGDNDNEANLITCDSIHSEYCCPSRQLVFLSDIGIAPRDLLTDYLYQFTTIEGFFRISVTEMHESEWLHMLQREVEERNEIANLDDQIRADTFFQRLPPAGHLLLTHFLRVSLLVMSFYFLIATLFIALIGMLTLTYIFFSMFSHPYNVFTYGVALFVTGSQFAVFCSRGYDVLRNTFSGRRIQALKAFGYRALFFQVIVDVLCTVGCFIVFCVMANRYGPLTGIQYSLAIGWITAVCLIFIYHVVFAFGFRTISNPSFVHGSRMNNAETTLYLFMDVDVEDDSFRANSSVEMITLTVTAVLLFAAGVAFMASNAFGFLATAVALQAFLFVLSTMFMFANNSSSSSNVTMCAVAYASIFWMDAIFTMGLYGWTGEWGNSLVTALLVMLFFSTISMGSVYGKWSGTTRRWLFRLAWALIVVHFVSCTVVLLVQNYQMGCFVLALGLHLFICCIRNNEASNTFGLFAIVSGFSLTVLTCCLIGNFGGQEVYYNSVSDQLLPDYHATYVAENAGLPVQNMAPPVCLTQFPSKELGIVGMSLFVKLGYNANLTAQAVDLARWFPEFKQLNSFGDGLLLSATPFRRVGDAYNTTVIAVRGDKNIQWFIMAMTMWIDQYVISFFSFLMPALYLENIMPYISFAQKMCPLSWKKSMDSINQLFAAYLDGIKGPNEFIYVVGHGPMGATAVIASLRSGMSTRNVLISGPEIAGNRYGVSRTASQLSESVIHIESPQSALSTWFLKSPQVQIVPCDGGSRKCDRVESTIQQLNLLCHP